MPKIAVKTLTLPALLLSAAALVTVPFLAEIPVSPAHADGGRRDKGEARERDREEARGGETQGKHAGGKGRSESRGPKDGPAKDGDPEVGGGTVGGGPVAGGASGGGIVDAGAGGGTATGGQGAPFLSGSSGTAPSVVILPQAAHPARLGPYADALAAAAAARSALRSAEADLIRLRALSGAALARAFPARAPDYDVAAHRRDLARLEGAAGEWKRLSRLTDAERAAAFPPERAGAGHDAQALAAAKRRALIQARDHDTLANLPAARLAALYPAPAAAGHDRAAHARAIAAAEAEVALRAAALARAEATAAETLSILTGGAGLTPREAAWIKAYLAR